MAADGGAYTWGGGRDQPMDVSGFVSDVLTDWELVESMRDEAQVVRAWAIQETQLTPTWRFLRRRYLADVVDHLSKLITGWTADLEAAAKRRAEVEATTKIGGDHEH
jgi:hypothetical protein